MQYDDEPVDNEWGRSRGIVNLRAWQLKERSWHTLMSLILYHFVTSNEQLAGGFDDIDHWKSLHNNISQRRDETVTAFLGREELIWVSWIKACKIYGVTHGVPTWLRVSWIREKLHKEFKDGLYRYLSKNNLDINELSYQKLRLIVERIDEDIALERYLNPVPVARTVERKPSEDSSKATAHKSAWRQHTSRM